MRATAYGLVTFLLVLIPLPVISAADAQKPSIIKLDATLTDGSHIKGEIPPPYLPIKVISSELGKLSVPLAKVAVINFNANHTEATVHLQKGDKLQGTLGMDSIKMTTLFGPVSLPLAVIKELQFRPTDGTGAAFKPGDWDVVPFPRDSDWPGPRGEMSTITDEEIVLQGSPARTREAHQIPFALDCELDPADLTLDQANLWILLFAPGPSRDEYPRKYFLLDVGCTANEDQAQITLVLNQAFALRGNSREIWRGTPLTVERRKPCHLRLEVETGRLRISLNDQVSVVNDITIGIPSAQIQLWNWQPTTKWIVRNPVLNDQ